MSEERVYLLKVTNGSKTFFVGPRNGKDGELLTEEKSFEIAADVQRKFDDLAEKTGITNHKNKIEVFSMTKKDYMIMKLEGKG